jgi:DNA-binding response OmpR family regulator
MRLSESVAAVERENEVLKGENASLRAQLAAQGGTWRQQGLSKAQAAIMNLLMPRPDHVFTKGELLAAYDHRSDVGEEVIDVMVCQVRKKLGFGAIDTVGGQRTGIPFAGFRLGPLYRP